MKKYTKPMVNVVELSVKESLSALPEGIRKVKLATATAPTITLYDLSGGLTKNNVTTVE